MITETEASTSVQRGRPKKSFEELAERSKRMKTDELINSEVDTVEKALLVTRKVAYRRGNTNMVKVIGHLLKNTEHTSKMLVTLNESKSMMSPEEAFEFFLDCDLSKYAYEQIVKKNPSRFPSYNVIKNMKIKCSPPVESIEETGSRIKAKLQALMLHTSKRIIEMIDPDIIEQLDTNSNPELVLLSSWGMDGSTGYS